MNNISIISLKILRKIYSKLIGGYRLPDLNRNENVEEISELIYNKLISSGSCMIARFGSVELFTLVNYLGVNSKNHSIIKYIKNENKAWWWENANLNNMQNNAGFFPSTPDNLLKFGDLMIKDIPEVDILGSWLYEEDYFRAYLKNDVKKISLLLMEPYWSKRPWSRALKGKNVLVIHPFSETIKEQFKKRDLLFKDKNVLPDFNLITIKAVQSLGGSNNFKDWFEALNWMKSEMDKKEYDICLIGCGAYGFPLAAHAKRQGKKAIHLGGALQLLFGIKGNRWENPLYGKGPLKRESAYLDLFNEYWCRPSEIEKPKKADKVENACYW